MATHVIGPISELPPGSRRIVEVGGRTIGVFNLDGSLYALRNACPHQGAPLCQGRITGTLAPGPVGEYRWERDGLIIRCPWHGWEFDITTGRSVFNPHRVRVRTYPVTLAGAACPEDDPGVETFPLSIEDGLVLLHA